MRLKIKKLHPDAIVPTYGTPGAACFDLHLLTGEADTSLESNGGFETYQTGLSFEIPPGFVMMIYSRSGHGFKHGVRLANCVGVIDSDYRGELMVKLHNDGEHSFYAEAGDRIAQAMIIPFEQIGFDVVEELSETERGAGGFGSTGK